MTARLLCTVLVFALVGCRKAPPPDGGAEIQHRDLPAAQPERVEAAPAPTSQLARVRPPPVPCLATRNAPADELVERAADLAERGDHARALACADEALRAEPRSVPALHHRASALVALGRTEDARRAFARALAVDPDDPETLLGAADFHVARSKGDRDGLLVGLEYALRGARLAGDAAEPDLAARLLLVAAMAENDLGASTDALAHANQALRTRPHDAALHYERGVALYELVRFAEARTALEQALSLAPQDPWALHHLALVAEHEGERERAAKLEAQARARAPRDFRGVEIGRAEFDHEVRSAVAALPANERHALSTLPLEVADVPSLDDLTAVEPPLSPTILGLYRGPSEHDACEPELEGPCRSVVLYWRNLARFARDRKELAEQVRVTLLHELGHFHGESDDELRDRGLE